MVEEPAARSRIFISYRREDTAGHVLALIPPLRERFGSRRIFKDTDNIAPGQDFLNVIQHELKTCAVLVAVIGRNWLAVQDPRLNCRRLEAPNDFLRLEVATALKDDDILVIPALVGKATMPDAEDLPADLQPLARRNAIELSDLRWDSDVERLIHAIDRACGQPSSRVQSDRAADSNRIGPKPVPEDGVTAWQRELLEARRKRQIEKHLAMASRALDAGDPDSALQSCEQIAWLDPDEPQSQALAEKARAVLERRRIDEWLE
jgi:TIR domain-containing protein